MKIIVCLDDRNGMLFNNRRQSTDRVLNEKIVELTCESTLWLHPFSQRLFEGMSDNICIDERYLELAGQGEFCFIETVDVMPDTKSIEQIIVFRWNRVYPADVRFPAQLLDRFRRKDEILTFPGSSHDKISMEVYSK